MHSYQQSIGRGRAVELFGTKWWLQRSAREIAKFQLFTAELCVPFEIFHRALEEVLGRPIWIHEFGLRTEELAQEFLGERDAPTSQEIFDLVPPGKTRGAWVDSDAN